MGIKMKLIIASNNAHKVREIKKILSGKFDEILSLREANVFHETVEDGHTFMENALKKAREIVQITDCAALADDSGICVDALGGAPGIYSARYSGDHDFVANRKKIFKELEGQEDRTAYFDCTLVMLYPNGEYKTADGRVYGVITTEEIGDTSFGYDCMFLTGELRKTFGEATDEEKNRISHRGRAIEKLKKLL